MNKLLIWMGRIAGLVGLIAIGSAFALRAVGVWHLGSVQVGTLMNAGIAAMVIGAWAYAASLAERERPHRP